MDWHTHVAYTMIVVGLLERVPLLVFWQCATGLSGNAVCANDDIGTRYRSINACISWFHIVARVDDHPSVGNCNTSPPALCRYIDDYVGYSEGHKCGLWSSKLFSRWSVSVEQSAAEVEVVVTGIRTILQPAKDGDVLYAAILCISMAVIIFTPLSLRSTYVPKVAKEEYMRSV